MEKTPRPLMNLDGLEIEPLSDEMLNLLGGSEISPHCCSMDMCSDGPVDNPPPDIWAS